MKKEELFDAINGIDLDLVNETQKQKELHTKTHVILYSSFLVLAAAIIILLCLQKSIFPSVIAPTGVPTLPVSDSTNILTSDFEELSPDKQITFCETLKEKVEKKDSELSSSVGAVFPENKKIIIMYSSSSSVSEKEILDAFTSETTNSDDIFEMRELPNE